MSPVTASDSLLIDPERHALFPAFTVTTLGTTLVIAPHSDDETLGCGGLLALLAEHGCETHVVIVTDGSRSHPHSASYPAARLAALRESETLAALAELGLPNTPAHFWRFADCGLPKEGMPDFEQAVERVRRFLDELKPGTILVPWRRDPHCDHEATWSLLRAANERCPEPPRWLEYPVWAWTRADTGVAPRPEEGEAWRLDIASVLPKKERALQQYRSQLGQVIRDDPEGFVLPEEMLKNFMKPWELFIEPADV